MRHIEITIPIGLGDLIYIKSAFEAIKDQFSQIKIRFGRHIINDVGRNVEYNKFLDDIGQLFFSEMPYTLDDGAYPFCAHQSIYDNYGITPQKPELAHLLCKGNSLNLDSEYIVITTKLRYFPRQTFDIRADELWSTLKSLTTKYKIVVLGEQEVEMNKEYVFHTSQHIYSIYSDIIKNIPSDCLVDLTFPSLGISSPNLVQVQQDCLIMKESKFVMTLGVGGNFGMATAVANTVGFRIDDEPIADKVFDREYPNAIITKNWSHFLNTMKKYL